MLYERNVTEGLSRLMFPVFARLKGEDNTVMRDYVLPDFSSIKKGFCKASTHLHV